MRAPAVLLPALALVLSGCLNARGTPDKPAVKGVELAGVHGVSSADLEGKIATQPSGRFFWQEEHDLDPDALAADQKRIERYYRAQGFYDGRVEAVETPAAGRNQVKVIFRIHEGDPSRVAELVTPGLEAAPEAGAKVGKLPMRVGDVFTEAGFDADRAKLLKALHDTGWAKAEVAQRAEVDPLGHRVRVSYEVRAGKRYRFGGVLVSGTAVVPRARVREEVEINVKPGATWDESQLGKAQNRVFDLGVFGGVRVSPGKEDPLHDTIPVVVAAREAPFRTIRAGPGFGIQGSSRYDVHGVASWTSRNWLGDLRKLQLEGRLGYAWLPSAGKQGLVGLASADLTQPGVFTRITDLNVRAEVERGREQAYDFWAERFRVGLPIKLVRELTLVPSYNLEYYQVEYSGAPPAPGSNAPQLFQSCPGNKCLLSYLEQRIAWDLRDDAVNTTRGLYLGLAVQEGFRLFGSGFEYLRLLPEARGFLPFGRGVVLASRLRLGILKPLGNTGGLDETQLTPIVARFTSGGPNGMRGYYTRMLSPVIQVNVDPKCPLGDACPKRYLSWGGDGLLDGSLELRFPISGNLGGATFLDFGNVALFSTDALDLSALQYALGFGVRYKTVFGPVRLDVAGRLPTWRDGSLRQAGTPVVLQRTGSSASAPQVYASGLIHVEPIVSVHLSIGEAF
ncbi:MAG TPA: BamA/TamA family outer membrane protein [Anaeromyxobacteraceae bacterium]|jgi:translocation and assembly module TamA|nr:BamA/TamA family outer membrane protein [Anaeromyxobacteraceae bacterium]